MYYSLKKNTVSLSLGFQISHLIPIRLPLSLSAIQKPQAFLPLDNHQTCAGFVNDGGCGWKMMTLVGGQIGTILTRSTFLFGICVIASLDGNDPVDEDAASAAATTLYGKRLSYFEKTMLFMFQEISMIWSR
ncbi:hypothetical protein HanPSC8_Chr07g0278891 [Helianthus annuus]|nr:hypothetical protein HanPSC8_Chr07g0278891 [Helianthus annuus]